MIVKTSLINRLQHYFLLVTYDDVHLGVVVPAVQDLLRLPGQVGLGGVGPVNRGVGHQLVHELGRDQAGGR